LRPLRPFELLLSCIFFLSLVFSSANHLFSPLTQTLPSVCSRNPVPFLTRRPSSPSPS
jgi:hypothetical protein